MESPETIQSLNPWVKIPDDWKRSSDEGTTSSAESYYPSHVGAEANFYSGGGAASYRSSGGSKHKAGDDEEPFFDHAMMTNLSEHLGSHAFLRCRVKNLGDRTVILILLWWFHLWLDYFEPRAKRKPFNVSIQRKVMAKMHFVPQWIGRKLFLVHILCPKSSCGWIGHAFIPILFHFFVRGGKIMGLFD